MAIELINPQDYENTQYPSLQDSLWHIGSSPSSGETDFKYVFDVYKGNKQLIRVKIFPEPSNGKGYFDASKVIKNEIVYDWFTPVTNDITTACHLNSFNYGDNQISIEYDVRLGEDFSGITTLNLVSGTTIALNYAPPLFQRKIKNVEQIGFNWLSNRPRRTKIKANTFFYDESTALGTNDKILIPFYSADNEDRRVVVRGYNNNNTQIFVCDEANIGNPYHNYATFEQLDIGADAMLNTFGNGGLGTTFTLVNLKYYIVEIVGEQNRSDIFRVDIACDNRYETINLYFINQYGMFDTARFGLASLLSMNIERKSYEKRNYDFNLTSVDYLNNGIYNESKINYGSKANWTYKLFSDFLTDDEYTWLAELITSPQIYAQIDGYFYPVTIKATNYEYVKYQNSKFKPFFVEIEMNQTRYGFLR